MVFLIFSERKVLRIKNLQKLRLKQKKPDTRLRPDKKCKTFETKKAETKKDSLLKKNVRLFLSVFQT